MSTFPVCFVRHIAVVAALVCTMQIMQLGTAELPEEVASRTSLAAFCLQSAPPPRSR